MLQNYGGWVLCVDLVGEGEGDGDNGYTFRGVM